MKGRNANRNDISLEHGLAPGSDAVIQLHFAIWILIEHSNRETVASFLENLPQDIREGNYDEGPYCSVCGQGGL